MNPLAIMTGVGALWKTVFGSKEKRDEYNANTNASIHTQFAAEFGGGKNWFDSLIDGLNRLPRPTFAFGIIYLFALCWIDPEAFARGASNLDMIPLEFWGALSIIITFYFGDRVMKGWGKGKIREHIAKNLTPHSEALKTEKRAINIIPDKDPQEGMKWETRVKKRYRRTDWDNLN